MPGAIEGRAALGERRGARDLRPGSGSRPEPCRRAALCADLDGFSLHAAVRIPAGCRERLETLCRYAARPPIVEDRLSLLPDGRVSYRLKKRYCDGSTHVVLDPLTFLERPAELAKMVEAGRTIESLAARFHGERGQQLLAGLQVAAKQPPALSADGNTPTWQLDESTGLPKQFRLKRIDGRRCLVNR